MWKLYEIVTSRTCVRYKQHIQVFTSGRSLNMFNKKKKSRQGLQFFAPCSCSHTPHLYKQSLPTYLFFSDMLLSLITALMYGTLSRSSASGSVLPFRTSKASNKHLEVSKALTHVASYVYFSMCRSLVSL